MEGVTILLIELNPPSPPGGYLVKPLFYHKGTQHMNWKITLGNNKGGNQLGLTRYLKYPNCISQTIPITYKKKQNLLYRITLQAKQSPSDMGP